jgi:hypothetical protein
VDQCRTAAGDPVEQGGLAHIGAPADGNKRELHKINLQFTMHNLQWRMRLRRDIFNLQCTIYNAQFTI